MAKFLPFVVENSTPTYIYQALISRSKGMNVVTVLSVFYLVVAEGVNKVRDTAASLPDIGADQVYDELLSAYPAYRISTEELNRVQDVGDYIKVNCYKEIPEDLHEYDMTDVMGFLYIMCLLDKIREYTTLTLPNLLNENPEYIQENLVSEKLFSNEGKEIVFLDKRHLCGYINFHTCVSTRDNPLPIKAVKFNAAIGVTDEA